jgi:sarcosine oxidase, subunit delta
MKLMSCPINGPRLISEFAYGGELRVMPDPRTASDAAWSDYVFNRSSVPGVKREWWCHTPSGIWFIAERDTATDTIQRTYLYQREPAAQPASAGQPDAAA